MTRHKLLLESLPKRKGPTFLVLVSISFGCSHGLAQSWPGVPQVHLTYKAGTSHKIEQITADCDWAEWDATILGTTQADGTTKITNPDPVCVPTLSQTVTRADVLGQDTGYSFEHNGNLIFLFGDTIGATPGNGAGVNFAPWTTVQNTFSYQAGDTMAWTTTGRSEDGLLLNYFLANGSDPSHALVVQPEYTTPQCFPDGSCGTALPMGVDDIPNSGISLNGQIYIVASSGTAPEMIGRFTEVLDGTLKIYYTLSTWNPYAVVEMESDFQITGQFPKSAAVVPAYFLEKEKSK